MRTRAMIAAPALLLLCAGIWSARGAGEPVAATKPAAKKTEDVSLDHADLARTVWDKNTTKVLLTGSVKFTHGDTVLTCDEVRYDRDANIAVSPGKLSITDPECDITGDKGAAYFKKRIGVVEGNVTMLVKPKKSEEQASNKEGSSESIRAKLAKPTTVTCQKLEYNYRDKIASATGGVVLKQERRTANANKLIYDENNEIITLLGDVHGVDEDGQTFSAPDKVTICVKKGAEWMEAPNASATFKVETEETTE
jgi:lipopolysaccharide assembly outer membrane protein LptD (OstA)